MSIRSAPPNEQNKHKFYEQQLQRAASEDGGGGKAARGGDGGPQSPRRAAAAAAAAGVPRAVALQQAQQQAQQAQQVQQAPTDPAKRLRAVQKKLRQITGIADKAAAGTALNDEERQKLAGRAALEAEAAALAVAVG